MPHLVILYSGNLDSRTDVQGLCRKLADTLLGIRDEQSGQVFPAKGVRVLAYPAAHSAISDGKRDYGFAYLNLRMGRGRSADVKQRTGAALKAVVQDHLAPLFAAGYVGVTLQIDEGAEVFDAKFGSIAQLFERP